MLGIPTQPTEVGTLNAVAPTVVIELNVASVSRSDLALGSRRICLSRQPEVSEACEQNQHSRAREKEVPDSHPLRQRSRDDQSEELRNRQDGHEAAADAPDQFDRRLLLHQRLRRYDDEDRAEADAERAD